MVVEHLPTNDHETQEKKLCQNNEKKKKGYCYFLVAPRDINFK